MRLHLLIVLMHREPSLLFVDYFDFEEERGGLCQLDAGFEYGEVVLDDVEFDAAFVLRFEVACFVLDLFFTFVSEGVGSVDAETLAEVHVVPLAKLTIILDRVYLIYGFLSS